VLHSPNQLSDLESCDVELSGDFWKTQKVQGLLLLHVRLRERARERVRVRERERERETARTRESESERESERERARERERETEEKYDDVDHDDARSDGLETVVQNNLLEPFDPFFLHKPDELMLGTVH